MKKNYTKKILLKVSLVLVLLVCVGVLNSQTYGPNLVLNGDFEANKDVNPEDNYYWFKNNSDIKLTEIEYSINNQSCRMPGAKAARFINQNIEISTPGTYVFKFTGRIQNTLGNSGEVENNHAEKGVATITATVKGFDVDGETLLENDLLLITTQSNANTTFLEEFEIPETITKIQVQIKKDWNVAYIDDVLLQMNGDVGTALNSLSSNFKVIPNGDNSITIRSDEALKNIRIINIYGQTILNTTTTNERINLPHNASKGIYIVEAITEKGTKMLDRFINK